MPTYTGTQVAAGVNLEDGYYECVITEAKEVQGDFGSQLEVTFKVSPGEDGEGTEFKNWFSLYEDDAGVRRPIRVGTMLGDLFSAALFGGEPYAEGEPLDTDDLPRKRVRVNYGEYSVKRGKNAGAKKRGVIAVKAAKRKAPAAPAKPASVRSRLVDDDDDLPEA